MKQTYLEGDNVIVHSLGNPLLGKEYKAIIRGISVNYGVNPATIYILETVDKIDPDYPYTHYAMLESCLRRDDSVQSKPQTDKGSKRFEFEGPHHLYNFVEHCYWVREIELDRANARAEGKIA